ncbi:MAG: microcystin degradation protein MlrC [Gammaproteobacteria bacterium]|nr:microcystin degradation protein MlrC [Gammaproteobacteria bacterium]
MARIAIGGWQHETNTFATIKADYDAFEQADEWPPMREGESMLEAIEGVHLPINGAIEALTLDGHELLPLLWCSATPSAHVTQHAFEAISDRFITLLKSSMPFDAVYLDLHGAMVCEHLPDGEGEFLKRVRAVVGEDMPIFISLDLHANVTPLMVKEATLMDIFRTYPHIDMGETGSRVGKLLSEHLKQSSSLYKAYRQIDFLIPLNSGCSLIEPCQGIYQALPSFMFNQVVSLSFAYGFHLSDIHDVGPAVVAYGYDENDVHQSLNQMVQLVTDSKRAFFEKIWPCEEGVQKAREIVNRKGSTVVLADTQDNPGGGGSGDTTGLLVALINQNVAAAVFGFLSNPDIVCAAMDVGVGGSFEALLGGKSGLKGQKPFRCVAEVEKITDGNLTATGPMYKGARMSLGPCALVNIQGVLVMISSKPVQTADQEMFRHMGIEPDEMDIIALKSSVHFRNDFTELASQILVVESPGAVFSDPTQLEYENIRPNLEILDIDE